MAERFASISENELCRLIEEKDSENTKRATMASVKVFNEYLQEKNLDEPHHDDKVTLANVLKRFYAEARKKSDGSMYSKSSMTSLRFGLNRHLKTKGTDIIQDPEFAEANKVFLAKCVDLKRQGLAKVEHKPAILENDLRKLYECGVFNLGEPARTLQNKVFFEIMLYFCRRGRQNLRELKIKDFSLTKDDKGARYVSKSGDELTKNRREDDEGFEGGMMFEMTRTPVSRCFVGTLHKTSQPQERVFVPKAKERK